MPKPDAPKDQRQKFIEAARAADCDESGSAFDATLTKIAKAPPPPDPKPKSRKAGKTEAPE